MEFFRGHSIASRVAFGKVVAFKMLLWFMEGEIAPGLKLSENSARLSSRHDGCDQSKNEQFQKVFEPMTLLQSFTPLVILSWMDLTDERVSKLNDLIAVSPVLMIAYLSPSLMVGEEDS
jgi:hypothetical protein